MRVIILRGNGDSGKSTTLNLVYDELTTSRYTSSISYKNTIGNPINKDFEAEVILTDKRVIGFYTMGDYDVKYIISAIKNFQISKVDVLIIASNSNLFKHFDFVICNFPYNIVNKTVSNSPNGTNNVMCNLQDCGTILSLL
jgi:Ni2+-binding GTPase involved in maturation of urease and hydrogenase